MSVSDMILELRTRAIADIERLQDFHVFTGHSYDRYEKMVAAGHLTGTVTNVRTRTAQTEKEVADLLLSYLDNELPQVVLYQLVSEFERFFFDFLILLMQQNPRALSQKRQLTVEEVVAQPDLTKLISFLIERELHELQYKSVQEWFTYLEKLIKFRAVNASQIDMLAELKATRDIIAHNAGIANEIYARKAGSMARARPGESLSVSRSYVYDAADFLKHLVSGLTNAAHSRLHS